MTTTTSNYIASANESLGRRLNIHQHPAYIIGESALAEMRLTAEEREALWPALRELRYQYPYAGRREFMAAEYFRRDLPTVQATDPRFTGWRKVVKYFLFGCGRRYAAEPTPSFASLSLVDAAAYIAAAFRMTAIEPVIGELRAIEQATLDFLLFTDEFGNEKIAFLFS